jgi:hypothetical protein
MAQSNTKPQPSDQERIDTWQDIAYWIQAEKDPARVLELAGLLIAKLDAERAHRS